MLGVVIAVASFLLIAAALSAFLVCRYGSEKEHPSVEIHEASDTNSLAEDQSEPPPPMLVINSEYMIPSDPPPRYSVLCGPTPTLRTQGTGVEGDESGIIGPGNPGERSCSVIAEEDLHVVDGTSVQPDAAGLNEEEYAEPSAAGSPSQGVNHSMVHPREPPPPYVLYE